MTTPLLAPVGPPHERRDLPAPGLSLEVAFMARPSEKGAIHPRSRAQSPAFLPPSCSSGALFPRAGGPPTRESRPPCLLKSPQGRNSLQRRCLK